MDTRNSPTTEPTWRDVLHWAREGNPPPPRRDARDEAAWRAALDPEAFRVLRGKGTEAPHSSPMCSLFEPGRYACAGCGTLLFDAASKYDSRSGWPSFTAPVAAGLVGYHADHRHGMTRIEATCQVCDGHLGHVFPDGPAPTGLRYCINALALRKLA
ncbi:peptide-methionine (R)-S-oxide reductase MsrB [Thermomonas sp.]|uniref:peptide-methionine (R)-S-oxide reductase MsrB n=1 Tax=Thermomonas sp. TaxID=1971895 RepID=UPI0035B02E72